MSSACAEVRWSLPSSTLPAARVLDSAAVIFPGAFDQHGCPLLVFPAETQCKLSEEISREEASHFIRYCLRLHRKAEEGLVSVVADLRQANLTITRFIAETLLLLEVGRRIIHSVYIVQPKKKSVQKQLVKLLTPGSKRSSRILFRQVFLKDVFELSNYIDRSQLTCSLGGYLIYCHESWVSFIKEIDSFGLQFLSVVSRLPLCISTLQSLAQLPVPADFQQLGEFCSVNEARFQRLRRDLGLDDLLKRCECLLEKLRFPENDPCFHAMAGTVLFTHTALEMLHNYNRISAAVEKVELLWQQAFSKARLQLHREAQQIQEQMMKLHREKIQPYRVQCATDGHRAESLRLEFETSVYTHAMALVRRAEDVIHTLAETVSSTALQPRAPWVHDLQRMKENLCSAVQRLHQTLRNVSDFHYTYNRCKNWYDLVLCKTVLQEVLRTGSCEALCESSCSPDLLTWRRGVEAFLRGNPCPEVQELVKLAHLATIITDPYLRHMGKQISHRCMTLRRLLTSPGAVPLQDLQLALQWQYEYLTGNHKINSPEVDRNDGSHRDSGFVSSSLPHRHSVSQCESLYDLAKWPSVGDCYHQILSSGAAGVVSAAGKPPSLSSFDSGFDGAGSSHLDTRSRREGLPRFPGNGDSSKSKPLYAQIHEENIASVSDSEDQHEGEFSLKRDTPQASIQIVPKITSDSLNLEIKVKRSATLPKNPWLSLPIDDLESSYTVTITPNSSNQQAVVNGPSLSKTTPNTDQSNGSQEQPTRTYGLGCTSSKDAKSRVLQSQSFEDSDLNPMDNVLSSTITDTDDKPSNTVEGEASLLWDTFDLHNLRQESCDRLDISLSDWVQREQQELQEVERTLDRAAEILQEEENVLAQEVILRDLLETQDLHKHWPLWDEDHSVVTPHDLVKSGVIGLLDDEVSSSTLNPQSEPSSPSSDSETFKRSEVCENSSDSPGLATESFAHVDGVLKQKVNRSDVLQELRDLQVLEEQIIEESLKLEALRCSDAEEILSEPALQSHVTTQSSCRMFLAQMEKQEVENMERSLRREPVKNGSGYKVVKCSVMERNSMLKLLDTESHAAGPYSQLVQSLDPDTHLSVLATGESSPQKLLHTDAKESTSHPKEVCTSQAPPKQAAKEESSLKVFLSSESLSPSSRSDPHSSVDATHYPAALDSTARSKFDQPCHAESATSSSLSHSPSSDVPASVHPERSPDVPVDEISSSDSTKAAEVSSSRKTNTEQAAFDPGGVLLTPVPKPRSAFCFDDKRTQSLSEKCASTAGRREQSETVSYDNTVQIPGEFTKPPQGKSQGRHMHNNNNNKNALVQPSLYNASSEPQETSESLFSVTVEDSSELNHNCGFLSCNAEAAEAAGRFSGRQRHDRDVYDGGGVTRAVCRSPLQMNTSTPQLDYKTPIVLDTGSGLMKAGFADQDLPTIVFPTVIGHPKYEEVMSAGVERELYVGHDAQHMRGVLTLKYPIRNGVVRNWDEMEMIWHHAFQQLAVSPEHHPVLLTEAAMNPAENRQRMIELMFETFSVPLTFVAMQAVLALYASGRTTGVVLDSGDGLSHSVPVFDGYCLPHAVQRFSLAGADVTLQLQKLLLEQGVSMQTSAELEIVREVKERCCCVALDYELEVRSGGSASSQLQYTLPDGQLISLTTERFRAPEILFKPELIGRDHYGMHESVFKSILQSDIDLRRSFVGNIVLSGGNTLLAGLPERLQQEIRHMVPVDLMECVRVTSPRDRDFSVWCGGAVLANLPVFSSAWITAHEYEEFGPQIVFRKCF